MKRYMISMMSNGDHIFPFMKSFKTEEALLKYCEEYLLEHKTFDDFYYELETPLK